MCEFGGFSFFSLSSKCSHCWWSSWARMHYSQWLSFVKYKTLIGGVLSRRHNLKSYRTFSDHFGMTLTYNGPAGSECPGARPAWLQELLVISLFLWHSMGRLAPSSPTAAYHTWAGKQQCGEGKRSGPVQPSRAGRVLCSSIFSHIPFPWHLLLLSPETESLFLSYADLFSFL